MREHAYHVSPFCADYISLFVFSFASITVGFTLKVAKMCANGRNKRDRSTSGDIASGGTTKSPRRDGEEPA